MEKWEEIKRQYESRGTIEIMNKEIGDNGRIKDMLTYVPFPDDFSGLRVLDIGCAGGWWTYLAEERGAAEVVGVDANPLMLKIAEANRPPGSKAVFVQGSLPGLRLGKPPLDRPFDVILCMAVLHYLPDPDRALKRIKALLAPGGRVLIESFVRRSAQAGPDIYKWQPTPQSLCATVRRHFSRISDISLRQGDDPTYGRAALWAHKGKGMFVLVTGASGAGKTYFAEMLQESFPGWRVIRPDVEMGLTDPKAKKPWGYDYAGFFRDTVRAAVEQSRIVVVEAVIPSPGARQELLSFVPPDWTKVCLILDQAPQELEDFCPYYDDDLWQTRYRQFSVGAPWRRTQTEDYDMIFHISPLCVPQAVDTLGYVAAVALGRIE